MTKTSELILECFRGYSGKNIFLQPSCRFSAKIANPVLRKYIRYFELHLLFPFALIFAQCKYSINNVLLIDHSDAIHLFYFRQNTAIVIVHDQFAYLASKGEIPEVAIKKLGRIYQELIHLGLSRAKKLLAVSEHTSQKLINIGFKQEIRVLNLTWKPWQKDVLNNITRSPIAKDYALLVSPRSWRKDRPLAINSVLELRKFPTLKNLELIIVGDPLSQNEIGQLKSVELEFVKILQNISDSELKYLYVNANFCIVTSKYEGYGLPILEANSLGTRCLHNNLPSFMEITCADNIILTSPFENENWPKIVEEISNIPNSHMLATRTERLYGYHIFANKLFAELHHIDNLKIS